MTADVRHFSTMFHAPVHSPFITFELDREILLGTGRMAQVGPFHLVRMEQGGRQRGDHWARQREEDCRNSQGQP
jgi:hypothetical protein